MYFLAANKSVTWSKLLMSLLLRQYIEKPVVAVAALRCTDAIHSQWMLGFAQCLQLQTLAGNNGTPSFRSRSFG